MAHFDRIHYFILVVVSLLVQLVAYAYLDRPQNMILEAPQSQ